MPVHSLLFSSAVLLGTANAVSYQMKHDYTSNGNFFDFFSFYDSASLCKNPKGDGDCWDPTSGAVHYVDNATARSDGLATVSGGPGSYQYTMKVDTRPGEASLGTAGPMKGRNSVRIEALPEYEFGKGSLIVLDLAHMPDSACGSWPAFWSFAPALGWPLGGEIDIIEGVNTQSLNSMTLHTENPAKGAPKCDMSNRYGSGSVAASDQYNDCFQESNAGCGMNATSSSTYGTGFPDKGGVYVMELDGMSGQPSPGAPDGSKDTSGINIWFFARQDAPKFEDKVDTSKWPAPLASFPSNPSTCDVGNVFQQQRLLFDITFCGQWAGNPDESPNGHGWVPGSDCYKDNGPSCEKFVRENPDAYKDTYWTVNSLFHYSQVADGGYGSSSSAGAQNSATASLLGGFVDKKQVVHDSTQAASAATSDKPTGSSTGAGSSAASSVASTSSSTSTTATTPSSREDDATSSTWTLTGGRKQLASDGSSKTSASSTTSTSPSKPPTSAATMSSSTRQDNSTSGWNGKPQKKQVVHDAGAGTSTPSPVSPSSPPASGATGSSSTGGTSATTAVSSAIASIQAQDPAGPSSDYDSSGATGIEGPDASSTTFAGSDPAVPTLSFKGGYGLQRKQGSGSCRMRSAGYKKKRHAKRGHGHKHNHNHNHGVEL